MKPLSRLGRRDHDAVTLITVVLVAVVFLALGALVVDPGLGRDTRRQAQNASFQSTYTQGDNLILSSDLHLSE